MKRCITDAPRWGCVTSNHVVPRGTGVRLLLRCGGRWNLMLQQQQQQQQEVGRQGGRGGGCMKRCITDAPRWGCVTSNHVVPRGTGVRLLLRCGGRWNLMLQQQQQQEVGRQGGRGGGCMKRCITDAPRWGCVTSNHVVPRGTGVRLLLRCGGRWNLMLQQQQQQEVGRQGGRGGGCMKRCITDAPRWGCVTSNHVVPRGTGVRLLLRCGGRWNLMLQQQQQQQQEVGRQGGRGGGCMKRCITDAPRWGCVTSNHVVPRGTGVRLLLRCGGRWNLMLQQQQQQQQEVGRQGGRGEGV